MYKEIEVTEFKETKSIVTFTRRTEKEIEVIMPIDYYREPMYIIRRNPKNNGYLIKGEVVTVNTEREARFYEQRAQKKWATPLKWYIKGETNERDLNFRQRCSDIQDLSGV